MHTDKEHACVFQRIDQAVSLTHYIVQPPMYINVGILNFLTTPTTAQIHANCRHGVSRFSVVRFPSFDCSLLLLCAASAALYSLLYFPFNSVHGRSDWV